MSLKGMMNNYFNGKPGKADYTKRDIPDTRPKLFKAVVKTRWSSLIGLNLLYLTAWIPAIVWGLLNLATISYARTEGQAVAPYISAFMLILCPLIVLTGPFNTAASYILRNWARDEHSFIWLDYKQALKANLKQGLLFGLFNGLITYLMYMGISFYAAMAANSFLFYIPVYIMVIAGILWELCAMVLPTLIVTYDLGFFTMLKNALIMVITRLPAALGILILTNIFPIAFLVTEWFFPSASSAVSTAVVVYYFTIGLAFNKLLNASFANMVCEQMLNPEIPGAKVDIGLRSEREVSLNESEQ